MSAWMKGPTHVEVTPSTERSRWNLMPHTSHSYFSIHAYFYILTLKGSHTQTYTCCYPFDCFYINTDTVLYHPGIRNCTVSYINRNWIVQLKCDGHFCPSSLQHEPKVFSQSKGALHSEIIVVCCQFVDAGRLYCIILWMWILFRWSQQIWCRTSSLVKYGVRKMMKKLRFCRTSCCLSCSHCWWLDMNSRMFNTFMFLYCKCSWQRKKGVLIWYVETFRNWNITLGNFATKTFVMFLKRRCGYLYFLG